MAFNSLLYLLFLPGVYLLYRITKDRAPWVVLLLASIGFYSVLGAPYLLAALGLVTLFTYAAGVRLAACRNEATRKVVFWSGVAGNIAILGSLKYLPVISRNLDGLFGSSFTFGAVLIATGVSYFTFQAISYLTDIYLEVETPERHLGYFALYMAFFPKLLQGPIERAGDLLPQLKEPFEFDYDALRSGLRLFTWGLFKKIVIADRLAMTVNPVFDNVHGYSGLVFIGVIYLYSLQIYFDFSGYTDMALGSARIFNINLTQNFNSPYLATSIAEFWRRWHISFSRWILDYIFKPLQMQWRDRGTWGTASALVVTFLVSGIWHGAKWGFVVWGLLHGVYLASSVFYKPLQKRIYRKLGIEKRKGLKVWQALVTFNLVSFAWIFFRAATIQDALYIISHLFSDVGKTFADVFGKAAAFANAPALLLVAVSIVTIVLITLLLTYLSMSFGNLLVKWQSSRYRWALYYIVILSIVLLGTYRQSPFLYADF